MKNKCNKQIEILTMIPHQQFCNTSAFLVSQLSNNNRILKMRRNSNVIPNYKERTLSSNKKKAIMNTIKARKLSLCPQSERNIKRSKSSQYPIKTDETTTSNIDLLKLEAAKLQCEFVRVSERTDPHADDGFRNLHELKQNQIAIIKKPNIRRIIKGRPQRRQLTASIPVNKKTIFKHKQFTLQNKKSESATKTMRPLTQPKEKMSRIPLRATEHNIQRIHNQQFIQGFTSLKISESRQQIMRKNENPQYEESLL